MERKGIKKVDFFEATGINASNFKGVNLKSTPGGDALVKILAIYPDLSADWLMTGNGEMLRTQPSTNISTGESRQLPTVIAAENIEIYTEERRVFLRSTRPRIPLNAAAGYLSIATDSASEADCMRLPVVTSLPDYDFTIITTGESMMPEYLSGDEVACRMVLDNTEIQWGRTHVLDTARGIILKNIYNDGDDILCSSINPGFKDQRISKSDIYHIARVVGLIRSK